MIVAWQEVKMAPPKYLTLLLEVALFSLLLFGSGSTRMTIVQAAEAHLNQPGTLDQASTSSLTIGGFDITRAGLSSLPEGAAFEEARASVATYYPQVSFTAFTTLTQQAATNADILVVSPTFDGSNPMTPLTDAEQNILKDFVTSGGCAILLPDNQDFTSANESLVGPFEIEIGGMAWGWLDVTIPNPAATPLTGGFHGEVSLFTQGWPGGLTDIGPYAIGYANNALGVALAIIEPGAVAENSGAVLVFSDATTFLDTADGGGFASNEILFLNSIASCQRQAVYLPALIKSGSQ